MSHPPAVPWAFLPSVTIPLPLSFCLFLLKRYEEWSVKSAARGCVTRCCSVLPPEQTQRAAWVFSGGDEIKACGFHPEDEFNLAVGDHLHQSGTPEALAGGGMSRGRRILLMGSDDEVKSLQLSYAEPSRKSPWEEQEQGPDLWMTKIHLRIWCCGLVARDGALKGLMKYLTTRSEVFSGFRRMHEEKRLYPSSLQPLLYTGFFR